MIYVNAADTEYMGIACDILAEAFFDEELTKYIFPDPQDRMRGLPAYFMAYITLAVQKETGVVIMTPDCSGVVVLLYPEFLQIKSSLSKIDYAIFVDYMNKAAQWSKNLLEVLDSWDGYYPEPHDYAYIPFLGVRRKFRGGGGVAALLTAIYGVLDRQQLPCYAESSSLRTRKLWLRNGWRDYAPAFSPAGAPEMFPIWRSPCLGHPPNTPKAC